MLTDEELLRRATQFTFLPDGADIAKYPKDRYFAITVEQRSGGTWAVTTMGTVWDRNLQSWEPEPRSSSLTRKDFLSIRFTFKEAIEISQKLVVEEKFAAPYSWEFWKNHPERINNPLSFTP